VSVLKQLPNREIDGNIRRSHDGLMRELQSVSLGLIA